MGPKWVARTTTTRPVNIWCNGVACMTAGPMARTLCLCLSLQTERLETRYVVVVAVTLGMNGEQIWLC
jgi:hypothetical protein